MMCIVDELPAIIDMMHDLPFIVQNRLRPKRLSDPYYDHTPEILEKTLSKRDDDLDWCDYRNLLGPFLPAGTYDEVVYFLPHAFRYLHQDEDGAFEMMTALIGFVSMEADALERDRLLEPSRRELMRCLKKWTETFQVRHYDKTECQSKRWGLEYRDIVSQSAIMCDMLDHIDEFRVHLDLAVNFVSTLTEQENEWIKAAWHLELARAQVEGITLTAENPELCRLLTDRQRLQASADVLLPEILQNEGVSTYWNDTIGLLDL